MKQHAPVVAIDGPSGAGKGTIAQLVAQRLGWEILDSGAIYRVLALAALHHEVALDNEAALAQLAAHLDVHFTSDEHLNIHIHLEGEDIGQAIRTQEVAEAASCAAALPRVREALLRRQRAFRSLPGLVADGRDIGTVVFPDAQVKIFLTASAEERAHRRAKQLQEKGIEVNMERLLAEIRERDQRDQNRPVAPLIPAEDALLLDSSDMDIEGVLACCLDYIREKLPELAV